VSEFAAGASGAALDSSIGRAEILARMDSAAVLSNSRTDSRRAVVSSESNSSKSA
jgi:hypothetical protein